jgi:hypothetical protein
MTQTLGDERTYTSIGDSPEWLVALVARGGGGFVEFRYGRKGFRHQRFLPAERCVEDPGAVISWTLELTERFDVAMGMAVRGQRRGRIEDCVRVNVLWADIDKGDVNLLERIPTPPSLICESSPTHLHAYWEIREPADLTDERERATFREALRRVQAAVRSDHVSDLARIMRVPGTLNWKRVTDDATDDPTMVTPIVFRPY